MRRTLDEKRERILQEMWALLRHREQAEFPLGGFGEPPIGTAVNGTDDDPSPKVGAKRKNEGDAEREMMFVKRLRL
jgi:hypothetical protein